MAANDESHPVTDAWRAFALRYPETTEAGVCVNAAFKAGAKSFFFMGLKPDSYHARIRLGDSIPEAEKLAAKQPGHYEVGKFGWTKVTFATDEAPPDGLMERWIDESYRLLAHKKLVARLPDDGFPTG